MDNIAEERFKEWLDKNKIPYWYLDQSLESFSPALKEYLKIKRPDFIILLPNFGFIFVDIKEKKPAKDYDKFFVDGEEVEKYLNIQRTFNILTWFVISNEEYHYKTWFWVPVTDIMKTGFLLKEKNAYAVPINEFIQVSDNDNLGRVFSKLLKMG